MLLKYSIAVFLFSQVQIRYSPTSCKSPIMDTTIFPGLRPGGWNRIHLIVDDVEAEVARLREAGATFRNDIVSGPGGKQVLVVDPAGNFVELFEAAPVRPA